MKVDMQPGSYILAVSGGIDSIALMHMLVAAPELKLTVAHFDHGIRADSHIDRQLVQKTAKSLGLPFVYDRAELGPGTSEAVARKHRYEFLRSVQKSTGAQALITAHHQDDFLETIIINLLRGTGRKGLSSLADRSDLRRPLLGHTKADIRSYAAEQGFAWREDVTNQDTTLLRNYVRHVLIPKLGLEARHQLLYYAQHVSVLNRAIDGGLLTLLHTQPSRQTLNRVEFSLLPHALSIELMAAWLRSHEIRNFDSKTLDRLVTAAKTLSPGKQVDIDAQHRLIAGTEVLALVILDR